MKISSENYIVISQVSEILNIFAYNIAASLLFVSLPGSKVKLVIREEFVSFKVLF